MDTTSVPGRTVTNSPNDLVSLRRPAINTATTRNQRLLSARKKKKGVLRWAGQKVHNEGSTYGQSGSSRQRGDRLPTSVHV